MVTSEEVTARRRAERKQFKLDRARAMAAAVAEAEAAFQQGRVVSTVYAADGTRMIPSAATWKPKDGVQPDEDLARADEEDEDEDEEPMENVEHLQLTLPEAFFLLWNLDCLSVSVSDVSRRFASYPLLIGRLGRYPDPRADMERLSKRTCIPDHTLAGSTSNPPIRQPILDPLRHLPPLPVPRLGRQKRHQILRRLFAL